MDANPRSLAEHLAPPFRSQARANGLVAYHCSGLRHPPCNLHDSPAVFKPSGCIVAPAARLRRAHQLTAGRSAALSPLAVRPTRDCPAGQTAYNGRAAATASSGGGIMAMVGQADGAPAGGAPPCPAGADPRTVPIAELARVAANASTAASAEAAAAGVPVAGIVGQAAEAPRQ